MQESKPEPRGMRRRKRLPQVLLIVTFIGFSWLGMQVVHETGHVLVARLTGGEVIKVALHPLIVSRTDLGQNPHPLAVVWAGPLIGSGLPLLVFALAAAFRWPGLHSVPFLCRLLSHRQRSLHRHRLAARRRSGPVGYDGERITGLGARGCLGSSRPLWGCTFGIGKGRILVLAKPREMSACVRP